MTLEELNAMPNDAAAREMMKCCGSARWASAMSARRPFRDAQHLYDVADEIWWSLDGADWLEAFAQHPRIGERAVGWARDEQSGTSTASSETIKALGSRNHDYERRFHHVFLIFAMGKSAEEMLAELERRITNDPATELRIAAAEQAKITRLRLQRMLAPNPTRAA